MTLTKAPRVVIQRMQRRLATSPGAPDLPSEQAISSIPEKRATPRW